MLDEIRPVSFVPLDDETFGDEPSDARLHERIQDDAQEDALKILERREMIKLVTAQMQKMPDLTRKVLAMYYFENMRLSEIAAVFRLTEGRISQIHTQAVLSLRGFLNRINKPNLCS